MLLQVFYFFTFYVVGCWLLTVEGRATQAGCVVRQGLAGGSAGGSRCRCYGHGGVGHATCLSQACADMAGCGAIWRCADWAGGVWIDKGRVELGRDGRWGCADWEVSGLESERDGQPLKVVRTLTPGSDVQALAVIHLVSARPDILNPNLELDRFTLLVVAFRQSKTGLQLQRH